MENTLDKETRKIGLTITEKLLGTCPATKDLYEKWVLSKAPVPDDEESLEELDTIADPQNGNGKTGLTVFHRDTDGIYLMDYHIKGFLKEAGNILKDTPQVKVKALRSKIDNYVFIFPRYIWIAEYPDGFLQRPLRAQTAQGPRIALACSEYIDPPRHLELTIDLLPQKELTWDLLEKLLNYGQYKGLGQFRNGSYGRFTWEYV